MSATVSNENRATIINETELELEQFCRLWEEVSAKLLDQAVDLKLYKAQKDDAVVPMLTYMLTFAVKEEALFRDFYIKKEE